MSSTQPTARPKRGRVTSTDGDQGDGRARRASVSIPTVSAEQRHAMIAESAYRRAERRGFTSGDPVADWLDGEKEVDALLARSAD
jgi:hypothetical protein